MVTTLVRLRAHERSVRGSCRGGRYRRFANCCSSLLSVRSTWSLEKVLREEQQQHDALQELQQEAIANSNTEPRPLVATGGQAPLGSTQPSAIDVAPASLNLDTIPAPHHHKRDRLPMSDEEDDSE